MNTADLLRKMRVEDDWLQKLDALVLAFDFGHHKFKSANPSLTASPPPTCQPHYGAYVIVRAPPTPVTVIVIPCVKYNGYSSCSTLFRPFI